MGGRREGCGVCGDIGLRLDWRGDIDTLLTLTKLKIFNRLVGNITMWPRLINKSPLLEAHYSALSASAHQNRHQILFW